MMSYQLVCPLLHYYTLIVINGVISFLLGYEAITHTPYYCSLRVVISIMYKLLDSLRLNVCKLFAALPTSQQQIVFAANPPGYRKVILSTNIAETSITLPWVKVVVDTGVVKAKSVGII